MCTIASGVSLTRFLGQEHFPSDVLIGAVTGWMIGRYVFEKHQVKHISKSKDEPPTRLLNGNQGAGSRLAKLLGST
jgi:ABC-type proline/glycine betaine transport system substrate-binding protein